MRKRRATLFVVALAAVAAAAPGFASRVAGGAQPAETPRQIIDITAERFAFTPLGALAVRGRSEQIAVFTPDPNLQEPST